MFQAFWQKYFPQDDANSTTYANVAAGNLFASGHSNLGWIKLSSPTPGTPGYASYNYCGGQCTYDMPVYSPPGSPNIVYIGGALQYDELGGPSNGRGVQRSQDAGVHFTDMTIDAQSNLSIHPDQHAIAAAPSNPNIVFIGNDGGVWRLNGAFTDASSQCNSRGLSGDDLKDCRMWLSKIPTTLERVRAIYVFRGRSARTETRQRGRYHRPDWIRGCLHRGNFD